MKRWTSYFPWIMLFIWMGMRMLWGFVLYPGDYDRGRTVGVLTNLLGILLVIFVAIISRYRNQGASAPFLSDVKHALGKAMIYVAGVTLLSSLYYGYLSNELDLQRQKDIIATAQALDTEEELAAIKSSNKMLETLSRDQIYELQVERSQTFTSAKVIVSAGFIALTLSSVLYALLGVFLFRNFVIPKKQ
jgi:hypothetical protein